MKSPLVAEIPLNGVITSRNFTSFFLVKQVNLLVLVGEIPLAPYFSGWNSKNAQSVHGRIPQAKGRKEERQGEEGASDMCSYARWTYHTGWILFLTFLKHWFIPHLVLISIVKKRGLADTWEVGGTILGRLGEGGTILYLGGWRTYRYIPYNMELRRVSTQRLGMWSSLGGWGCWVWFVSSCIFQRITGVSGGFAAPADGIAGVWRWGAA